MAELMDLTVDVIINILLRLSAKPLMQFKSVCKLWYQLIISPLFATLHLEQTLTQTQTQTQLGNLNLRFVFSAPHLSSADFDTFDHITELDHPFRKIGLGYAHVMGSCHGLLCLSNGDRDLTIILYNPTNRTYKKLPFLSTPLSFTYYSYFGFGYDSASRDFKFVRILKSGDEFIDEVMVYSLRADSWTSVQDFPRYFSPQRRDGVFFYGNLHWLHEVIVAVNVVRIVIRFGLSDHKFDEVPQPPYEQELVASHVGVLDGCLCLLANDVHETDIWVMKEYGVVGSWTRMFRVKQQHFGHHFHWPIAFSASKQELSLQLTIWRVVSLDLKTMAVKDINACDFPRCLDTHVCVENLMILKDSTSDISEIDHNKKGRKRRRRHRRGKKRVRENQDIQCNNAVLNEVS